MNTKRKTTEMKDRKMILSTLWIFVMFNYIYLDIAIMNFNPELYQKIADSEIKMHEDGPAQKVALGAKGNQQPTISLLHRRCRVGGW